MFSCAASCCARKSFTCQLGLVLHDSPAGGAFHGASPPGFPSSFQSACFPCWRLPIGGVCCSEPEDSSAIPSPCDVKRAPLYQGSSAASLWLFLEQQRLSGKASENAVSCFISGLPWHVFCLPLLWSASAFPAITSQLAFSLRAPYTVWAAPVESSLSLECVCFRAAPPCVFP